MRNKKFTNVTAPLSAVDNIHAVKQVFVICIDKLRMVFLVHAYTYYKNTCIFLFYSGRMESSGRPEQVHISEQTCNFLGERYHLEDGEDVDGMPQKHSNLNSHHTTL